VCLNRKSHFFELLRNSFQMAFTTGDVWWHFSTLDSNWSFGYVDYFQFNLKFFNLKCLGVQKFYALLGTKLT